MVSSGVNLIEMDDLQLEYFYGHLAENTTPPCAINEYLIIETRDKRLLGPFIWTKDGYEEVRYRTFKSMQFGEIKPKNNDPFQIAYMDSIHRNQITFAIGPSGSGKSLIGLAYAFQEFLEKDSSSQIIIFHNPYVARSAVKLGFLPGTKSEKLLETNIGSILMSKLGRRYLVEEYIAKERIVLMPMGDARGYEVPEGCFVYFTEAQNTNVYLMQLFLQRLNDSCKVVVEGDIKSQVDSEDFQNGANGLARAIDVFRGEDYAGRVELKHIYRGRIAKKADEM